MSCKLLNGNKAAEYPRVIAQSKQAYKAEQVFLGGQILARLTIVAVGDNSS